MTGPVSETSVRRVVLLKGKSDSDSPTILSVPEKRRETGGFSLKAITTTPNVILTHFLSVLEKKQSTTSIPDTSTRESYRDQWFRLDFTTFKSVNPSFLP